MLQVTVLCCGIIFLANCCLPCSMFVQKICETCKPGRKRLQSQYLKAALQDNC